jgi:hypothetical protein
VEDARAALADSIGIPPTVRLRVSELGAQPLPTDLPATVDRVIDVALAAAPRPGRAACVAARARGRGPPRAGRLFPAHRRHRQRRRQPARLSRGPSVRVPHGRRGRLRRVPRGRVEPLRRLRSRERAPRGRGRRRRRAGRPVGAAAEDAPGSLEGVRRREDGARKNEFAERAAARVRGRVRRHVRFVPGGPRLVPRRAWRPSATSRAPA